MPILALLGLCFQLSTVQAQTLKPGFDKEEYIELLKAYAGWRNPAYNDGIAPTDKYRSVYKSPEMGLENRWELLHSQEDSVAVISLRGTTRDPNSWLANVYAAMVPAKGQLKLTKDYTFNYRLSANPKAAVHVGWLVSTGFLVRDILPQIDASYKAGTKDFLILGHSQGGAIAYLLTSHLLSLQQDGLLPADLRFKTYCSAAPKPGNLYYAYEFENATAGGWAFNIVNAADWVPETPVSIQTMGDFNQTNPFTNAKAGIKRQKFPKNLALTHVYKQLTKPTQKAQRKYQKYLGNIVSKFTRKQLKEFEEPVYYESNHYVRTGDIIVLMPDEKYYALYPDSKERVFVHHMLQPYLYLAERLK